MSWTSRSFFVLGFGQAAVALAKARHFHDGARGAEPVAQTQGHKLVMNFGTRD